MNKNFKKTDAFLGMDIIGIALALLSAASSGFSVVLVGRNASKSSAFNMSLIISCVGAAALWPFAFLVTNFQAVNIIGVFLFAVCGVLSCSVKTSKDAILIIVRLGLLSDSSS